MSSLFAMIFKGGILMIPIGICSLIALGITAERWLTLRKIGLNTRTFVLQVKNLLLQNMSMK